MGRTSEHYGLRRLTFEEAARILGITPGALIDWAADHIRASPGRWSKWKHDKEPLPEAIIRLYLDWLRELQSAPVSPAPSAALPPVKESPRIRERRRAGGK